MDVRTEMLTRSYCEDLPTCALVLKPKEGVLCRWKAYVGRLVLEGVGFRLRFVVGMLLDRVSGDGVGSSDGVDMDLAVVATWWWR